MIDRAKTVAITGGCGNLGSKLARHLLASGWCERVYAIDRPEAVSAFERDADERWVMVPGNLADPADEGWFDAIHQSGAVIHFAAASPSPSSSWAQATSSIDMTARVARQCLAGGTGRLVFASSNHTMGRYKDSPLADDLAPGGLRTDLMPGPGTRYIVDGQRIDGVAYGASKLMGERVCSMAAEGSAGRLTAVSIRIGWCQQGVNRAQTITGAGVSTKGPQSTDTIDPRYAERDLRWFRNMWLSNRDAMDLFEKTLRCGSAGWPTPGIVVNGMSANTGMGWDIATTTRLTGYAPRDDIWRDLAASGDA